MDILRLIRVRSWFKNIFIFAPIFFAGLVFDITLLTQTCLTFVLFCFLSSAVYIINDLFDLEQDRKHESKKGRPLASGRVAVPVAMTICAFLLLIVFVFGGIFIPEILWIMALYFLLNILYSKKLKHIPIVDILCISLFFLMRIVAGGVSASVHISYWLMVCTVFLSLFIVVGKRLVEFTQEEKRPVLRIYSKDFLRNLLMITAVLVIGTYSIYALVVLDSIWAIISIFFVLLGILRYLYLIYTSKKVEYPEKVVLQDVTVFASVALWMLTMFYIFYF